MIEYMQGYADLFEDLMKAHKKHSTNWKSKIRQQSTLSSYHTTKRAQIQTVASSDELVKLLEICRNAIKVVIESYQKKLDEMYPKSHLWLTRKHHRSDRMKKLFKDEYSDLAESEQKVQTLKDQQKKIQQAIDEAKENIQKLADKKSVNQDQISKAKAGLAEKEKQLQTNRTDIIEAENDYQQAQGTYRRKATEIYFQCREFEQERLNDIRDVLQKFLQAVHLTEFSQKQNQMYETLIGQIKEKQNTDADLDYWGKTYRIFSADLPANPENHPITTCDNTDASNVVDAAEV